MRVIEVITEVKTKKFEAYDGTVFENESDCKQYEKSYKCIIKKKFDDIPKTEINGVDYCIPYANEDCECYAMKFDTLEELSAFDACVDSLVGSGYYTKLEPCFVGKILLVNFGYDRDYCDVYIAEDMYRECMNSLNNLKQFKKESEG